MIYLDNASTTKTSESVNRKILEALEDDYFNPSSLHTPGFLVRQKLEKCRRNILTTVGASGFDLVFTGSATEANNMALSQTSRGKILVGGGEHPSVLEKAKNLKEQGRDVEILPLDANGCVRLDAFRLAMTKDVSLVSVQLVSNETGAINDIVAISKIAKQVNPRVVVHSDMVQAFGKIPVKISALGVDLASISAHKICGPKGVGALVFAKTIKLRPIIFGGGQENGLRSGTENVPQIVAFEEAVKNATENQAENYSNAAKMKQFLLDGFKAKNLEFSVHGNGSPFILSVSFSGVRGETLMHALEQDEILISTGSACSSKKVGNVTLSAMGAASDDILGNVRISFGNELLSDEKLNFVVDCIAKRVNELKK